MTDTEQIIPEILVSDYIYALPDEKIARYPNGERDSSKLLIYDGMISEYVFSQLPELIPADSLLVFNNSKVIKARIFFRKETGAMIEVFCLHPAVPSAFEESLSSMYRCSWWCAVGNAKKWKNDFLEKEFEYEGKKYSLKAKKVEINNDDYLILFEWDAPVDFSQTLDCCGNIPVPPYLKRDSEQIDEYSYQTVYSKLKGSVAAPTAGLHFTKNVLTALENKGIDFEEITLHVGAGTFKPIKEKLVHKHEMHHETFIINRAMLEHLRSKIGKIIAVGTTSARMLESLYWLGVTADDNEDYSLSQWEAYRHEHDINISIEEAFIRLINKMERQKTTSAQASTGIMIIPGYRFRTVKGLITNFHQPESTLILLVAAFVGDRWRDIYDYAMNNDFRFLSYGDCSLLFRNK